MGLPCLVHGGTETSTKHTFLTTKQERNRAVGLFVTGAQLLKISLSQSGACPLSFNAAILFLKIWFYTSGLVLCGELYERRL